jgi:hypothetical protein
MTFGLDAATGGYACLARWDGLARPRRAMAVIEAAGLRSVVPVTQAHGGWPAIRLRRRLGDRVTKIVVLSWMVLDPPPTFLAVFGMLQDPGGGGRVSTSSRAGAPPRPSPGGCPAATAWPEITVAGGELPQVRIRELRDGQYLRLRRQHRGEHQDDG